VHGKAIVVSQFTLFADTRKGNRPSFTDAALPAQAKPLCERFTQLLREQAPAYGQKVCAAAQAISAELGFSGKN
jgi:D-tyrosyl-tRNA(Tyr) deacylase